MSFLLCILFWRSRRKAVWKHDNQKAPFPCDCIWTETTVPDLVAWYQTYSISEIKLLRNIFWITFCSQVFVVLVENVNDHNILKIMQRSGTPSASDTPDENIWMTATNTPHCLYQQQKLIYNYYAAFSTYNPKRKFICLRISKLCSETWTCWL